VSPDAIAVVGAYHTPLRSAVTDQSLEEMIFAAVKGALADAALDLADIDAITMSTTDQVEGRVIESMVSNGAAGGVGRDVTTLASAGEHAFVYGYVRIKAGHARRVLSVVWSKESESVDPRHADWLTAEPFLLRPLGMSSVAAAGLQASAYVQRYGLDREAIQAVRDERSTAFSKAAGAGDFAPATDTDQLAAWPLTVGDLPRRCDVAAAAVLSAADAVTDDQVPAWLTGVGWVSEAYELADRDLTRFAALEAAARMALGPGLARGYDLVEVQELSTIASFAARESLGLSSPGEGAQAARSGDRPVNNPSGGNLPANPGNAAGYLRFLAAAQQVRGRAEGCQVEPRPRSAVGAAMHGFAGQGAAVVSFSSDRGEH
jgi:hypothetical protein